MSLTDAINHLLRGAGWARERLAPFAGEIVRFEIPPISSSLSIAADGLLQSPSSRHEPKAVVRLDWASLLRLVVLRDDSARASIAVEGDPALAAALVGVLASLRWDVEEDLSRLVGDLAAHRVVRGGSALMSWQVAAVSNLASSLVEYATQEQQLIAAPEAIRQFVGDVDRLREDVDRLEKRIERLVQRAPRSSAS